MLARCMRRGTDADGVWTGAESADPTLSSRVHADTLLSRIDCRSPYPCSRTVGQACVLSPKWFTGACSASAQAVMVCNAARLSPGLPGLPGLPRSPRLPGVAEVAAELPARDWEWWRATEDEQPPEPHSSRVLTRCRQASLLRGCWT